MLMALVASIPAFYDSLMPQQTPWAASMYILSGALVLVATWYEGRTTGTRLDELGLTQGRWKAQQTADWILGFSLFTCAFMPPSSQSFGALGWRLVIALATLMRLIIVSKPIFAEAGLGRLLAMASAVLGLCGLGFYWIDPEVSSFSEGLWLAFSTAATVGYGDVVPSTTASRIFSVFVVLLGYGMLSLVTASIAAMFVGSQERKMEREILKDLHRQMKIVREDLAELRKTVHTLEEEKKQRYPD